jgi:hypothetical protein
MDMAGKFQRRTQTSPRIKSTKRTRILIFVFCRSLRADHEARGVPNPIDQVAAINFESPTTFTFELGAPGTNDVLNFTDL